METFIRVPRDAEFIIERLESHGYEAFVVGGCVRDACLGRIPADWDITTSATPDQVKQVFKKTIDTGIEHGTVTVMMHGTGYEVTTYRLDGEYEDNRHPKEVAFTSNLSEDLKRRDFTINAMAYNSRVGLVDQFDGIGDLKRGLIRCVGDAEERFDEDALRVMRAVRFSAQLGFDIEESTYQAIKNHKAFLKNISEERIRVELTKLVASAHADRVNVLYATGILEEILPELTPCFGCEQHTVHHIFDVGEHIVRSVMNMNFFFMNLSDEDGEKKSKYLSYVLQDMSTAQQEIFKTYLEKALAYSDPIVRDLSEKDRTILSMTMLLHDIDKPTCKTVDERGITHFYNHQVLGSEKSYRIMRKLTFDNESVGEAKKLILWHDYRDWDSLKKVRKNISKYGDGIYKLFLVQFADVLAQNPDKFEGKFEKLFDALEKVKEVLEAGVPLRVKDLKINGNDLINLGYEKGPAIGKALNDLLGSVLDNPELNEKEKLTEIARDALGNNWEK